MNEDKMCKLLISVRSAEEAILAKACGADFIDLKDPKLGALGALDLGDTAAILAALNGETVVSATIGDIPMEPEKIDAEIARRLAFKIDYLKVGFFSATIDAYKNCLDVIDHYTKQGYKIIVVLFADLNYPSGLMTLLSEVNLAGVMLDTMRKNGLSLMDHYRADQLQQFINKIKMKGRLIGLAGSLQVKDVDRLKQYNPDYLGFRGGVCDANQREGVLDARRIKQLSKVL